ncbi:MAG: DUF2599 domain-containing protein [Actinobacteria bacterium]|nr:DUF2599 domain-containing protein [Actinomycetota bacterium]
MKKLLGGLIVLGLAAGAFLFLGPSSFGDLLDRRLEGADGLAPSTEPGPAITRESNKEFVARVTPETGYGGTIYHVRPTRAGRTMVGDQIEVAWSQAVAKGVPDTRSMYNQFKCHPLSVVARAKPTWDLESWRPNVGLTQTMLRACNPS